MASSPQGKGRQFSPPKRLKKARREFDTAPAVAGLRAWFSSPSIASPVDRVQYFERLPAVIDLLDGIEADRRLVGKQARALLRSGVEWTAEEQSTLDGLADQAKEEASRHAYAKLTLAWIQLHVLSRVHAAWRISSHPNLKPVAVQARKYFAFDSLEDVVDGKASPYLCRLLSDPLTHNDCILAMRRLTDVLTNTNPRTARMEIAAVLETFDGKADLSTESQEAARFSKLAQRTLAWIDAANATRVVLDGVCSSKTLTVESSLADSQARTEGASASPKRRRLDVPAQNISPSKNVAVQSVPDLSSIPAAPSGSFNDGRVPGVDVVSSPAKATTGNVPEADPLTGSPASTPLKPAASAPRKRPSGGLLAPSHRLLSKIFGSSRAASSPKVAPAPAEGTPEAVAPSTGATTEAEMALKEAEAQAAEAARRARAPRQPGSPAPMPFSQGPPISETELDAATLQRLRDNAHQGSGMPISYFGEANVAIHPPEIVIESTSTVAESILRADESDPIWSDIASQLLGESSSRVEHPVAESQTSIGQEQDRPEDEGHRARRESTHSQLSLADLMDMASNGSAEALSAQKTITESKELLTDEEGSFPFGSP